MSIIPDTTEVWKPVVGYEGLYEVSSYGNVRRHESSQRYAWLGRTRQANPNHQGYLQLELSKGNVKTTYKVHKLVALAFLGPRPEGYSINHKDGVKQNNHASNLEYVTPKENTHHAYKLGLRTGNFGAANGSTKLTAEQVEEILTLKDRMAQRKIAERFGVHRSTITKVFAGRTWKNLQPSLENGD